MNQDRCGCCERKKQFDNLCRLRNLAHRQGRLRLDLLSLSLSHQGVPCHYPTVRAVRKCSMYSEKELRSFPHLGFCEGLYQDGWRTPPSYGPAKYGADIPAASGVYLFALIPIGYERRHPKPFDVAYVGKSLNLKKRHEGHAMLRVIRSTVPHFTYVDLWFKTLPSSILTGEEIKLIRHYNPSFNIQHRVRGIR